MLQLQAMRYIETTPPSPPLHTYMTIADKVLRVLLAAALMAIIIDSAMGWMSLRTLSEQTTDDQTRFLICAQDALVIIQNEGN